MSLPKFGLLSNPSIEILREIRTIKRFGFDYVELGIEVPEGKPSVLQKKRTEIRTLLKEFETRPLGHTAWWTDLGSDYQSVRKGWILESRKSLEVAKQLGIGIVNFHSYAKGLYFGAERQIILDNWVRSMREIVSYGKSTGVEIMLENIPAGDGIHKLQEFKYIIDHVPALKVHLDIAHAFTSGGMKAVIGYIRTFRSKIVHVHWHDNHGKEDEHLPIGSGLINHERAVRELKHINYNGTITLEVFTSKSDAKKSMIKLKKLWETV